MSSIALALIGSGVLHGDTVVAVHVCGAERGRVTAG